MADEEKERVTDDASDAVSEVNPKTGNGSQAANEADGGAAAPADGATSKEATSPAKKSADERRAARDAALLEAASEKVRKDADASGVSRRTAVIGGVGLATLLVLGGLRYVGHKPLCHPPGGQDEKHLVSACIRCQRCIEACPRKVLVPAHIEDGLLGMRAPTFDFNNNYCDFCQEENGGHPLCAQVCPSGALQLPADATPQNTIMGKASIDTSTCLAYRDTGCRYCYDACPYDAIELTNDGVNPKPVVKDDICNGCGACESVCVSLKAASIAQNATERAIKVRPNT